MEKETINGFVEKVVYRNTENGYTVVNISVEGDDVVCTGYFSDITEGNQIIAEVALSSISSMVFSLL